MFITILVFIIILGILVFVHELGHFVVARKNGIKAYEFGFGFPPRLVGVQFLKGKDGKSKPKRNWRIIWGSKDGDDENEKEDLQEAREKNFSGGTIYSLNWIPIGGFVRIKGEDGENKKDPDSFASKSAGARICVLAAGVAMNFVLAWVLLSATFMLGTYKDVTGEHVAGSKILVESIEKNSPAEKMGLKIGDIILGGGGGLVFSEVQQVQKYINENRGNEVTLIVQRGNSDEQLNLVGIPREQTTENQGALGISGFGEVIKIKYPFFQALWKGIEEIGTMLVMTGQVIVGLIAGEKTGLEVMGPVKLAIFTGQIIPLGFTFLLRFIAIFSVNLGIINILPFPALDGGRILFILIEKIKGKPVSQKVEQAFHSVGMMLLLALMLFITVKEIFTPEFIAKIKNIL